MLTKAVAAAKAVPAFNIQGQKKRTALDRHIAHVKPRDLSACSHLQKAIPKAPHIEGKTGGPLQIMPQGKEGIPARHVHEHTSAVRMNAGGSPERSSAYMGEMWGLVGSAPICLKY